MKWLKRLSISLTIAFFGIACGAVLLFNWGALGWKVLSVPTGSMRPTIPPGSLVLMHRVPYSTLKVGDVITYTNPQNVRATISHRIIKMYKASNGVPVYITKGDANPSPDPMKVVAGQVVGKAVWHAPHIGQTLRWSKTWVGLAILVYLPAAIVMWGAALDMADHMRKFQLYELKLFPKTRHRLQLHLGRNTGAATLLTALFVAIFGLVAVPASALLRSNTVILGPNHLTVVGTVTPPPPPPPPTCSGNNHNSTTINNSNNQTATTGNASNSNNTTTTGNTTSGNASNSNSTTITVSNTNNCS